jgi:hypothetical protein
MVMLPTVSPSTLIGAAYRLIPPLQGMSTGLPASIERTDASLPDSRQCHSPLSSADRLSVVSQRVRDAWSRNRHQSDATRHEAWSPFFRTRHPKSMARHLRPLGKEILPDHTQNGPFGVELGQIP